jgi:DNA polymerase-3 subunit chi
MRVDFYHLAASPIERVLPRICERLVEEGERLVVVGEADLLDRLDQQLWTYRKDAFLPHGQASADAANAQRQPILLSLDPKPLNGAANIALADGRWRDEALAFARTFYFFDNGALDEARRSWRALKGDAGVECRYWKQDENGRWVEGP